MKIRALMIAPYAGLVELTKKLRDELTDFDIEVIQGDLSEGVSLLKQADLQQFDVIISRGGTASLLREHTHLPVVDILISGFDLLRLLKLVEGDSDKIHMIAFPNMIEGLKSISSLIQMDIAYSVIHHEEEVDALLQQASRQGAKIIIGDHITIQKTGAYDLQGILITSGRESVLEAFYRAKQMVHTTRKHREYQQGLEVLLNQNDQGYALFNKAGRVLYSNTQFQEIIHLNQTNLFENIPYLQRWTDDLDKVDEGAPLHVIDPDRRFVLKGGRVKGSDSIYYVNLIHDIVPSQYDIHVTYWLTPAIHSPVLLLFPADTVRQAKQLNAFPAAIYGEPGTGKRKCVMHCCIPSNPSINILIHLGIEKPTEAAFSILLKIIANARKNELLFIEGIEVLPIKDQKKVVEQMVQNDTNIMFSFTTDPLLLLKSEQLEEGLYQTFQNHILHIPPLREQKQQLEHYIRRLLIHKNERDGKQIVGLRPEVLKELYSYKWEGNMAELDQIMDDLVKKTNGEYIEEGNQSIRIRSHQTLEEMEQETIQKVLKEENMNQSQAALRLGISRSTLWRKLKP